MPRSASFWLSQVLGIGHDTLFYTDNPMNSVETAVSPYWRLIPKDVQLVTIRRKITEVTSSFERLGAPGMEARMQYVNHKLNQVESRLSDVLSIKYEDIDREDTIRNICNHCGISFNRDQWLALSGIKLDNSITIINQMMLTMNELEIRSNNAKRSILERLIPNE